MINNTIKDFAREVFAVNSNHLCKEIDTASFCESRESPRLRTLLSQR